MQVSDDDKVLALRRRVNRGGNMDSSQLLAWLDGIDGAVSAIKRQRPTDPASPIRARRLA